MLLRSKPLRHHLQIWTLAAAILGSVAISLAGAEEPPAPAAPSKTDSGAEQNTAQQGHAAEHAQAPAAQNPLPAPATTSHTIELPGRKLRFKAIASAIRLSNAESLAPMADIATVALLLEGADPAKRPVTFAINGGPGAASAWLDLGSLGPWRLPFDRTSLALSLIHI